MTQKVACVVPAAGWGSLSPARNRSKLVEDLGGQTMVERVIATVTRISTVGEIVVITGDNPFRRKIEEVLSAGFPHVQLALQPDRLGAADAVMRGLRLLDSATRDVLVTFADMPLWRTQTLDRLIRVHLAEASAKVSMVTLQLQPGHRTERYGRIVRDDQGRILAAVEPDEVHQFDLSAATRVNPSLYAFDRQWLENNIPAIEPVSKHDGFAKERHLPKLLPLAYQQGVGVNEIELEDATEALGVNTPEELAEVRTIIALRAEEGE